MTGGLPGLLARIEDEAAREEFPIDIEVYRRAGRPPLAPILSAGNKRADVCFFARDLGVEEVLRGEPLIGSAGRRVRRAVVEHVAPGKAFDPPFYTAGSPRMFLTNTVPYKPVGNVEFSREVKSRFRPFIEELLVSVWTGAIIIPMGEGAFKWFAPYAPEREVLRYWDDRERRFTGTMTVTLRAVVDGVEMAKEVTLAPVPHPSPRSPFMKDFTRLLEGRLKQFLR